MHGHRIRRSEAPFSTVIRKEWLHFLRLSEITRATRNASSATSDLFISVAPPHCLAQRIRVAAALDPIPYQSVVVHERHVGRHAIRIDAKSVTVAKRQSPGRRPQLALSYHICGQPSKEQPTSTPSHDNTHAIEWVRSDKLRLTLSHNTKNMSGKTTITKTITNAHCAPRSSLLFMAAFFQHLHDQRQGLGQTALDTAYLLPIHSRPRRARSHWSRPRAADLRPSRP